MIVNEISLVIQNRIPKNRNRFETHNRKQKVSAQKEDNITKNRNTNIITAPAAEGIGKTDNKIKGILLFFLCPGPLAVFVFLLGLGWYAWLLRNKIFFLFYLSPGRYQQLDLFIKVLRLLCPNLTDAKSFPFLFDLEFVCQEWTRLRNLMKTKEK